MLHDSYSARGARRILALTSVGVFIVFLDTTIVNVAFATIGRALHAGTAELAWALNAYSLVFAAVLVPAGRLADAYGRKRVFQLGLVGFAAASAVCGLAPDLGVLIAARAVQGAFAALVVPSSLSLLLPEFPLHRRATAIGTWGAMGAVAAATGPTVGALLVEYANWRWVFLVNVPVCMVAAAVGMRALTEARDRDTGGLPDPLGVLLTAVSPGLLSLAVIEGPTWGWGDGRVVASFVLGLVLVPVFLWRSRRAVRPAIDLDLFRVRRYQVANAAMLVFSVAFFAALLAGVLFLQTVWHYSVLRAALAISPAPLLAAAVARPAGRLADRYGHRVVIVPGAFCYAAATAYLAAMVDGSPHWVSHWLPASLLSGVGIGLTLPTLGSAAAHALPPARYAVGSAVSGSFRQLGGVLGVSLFVALLGTPTAVTAVSDFHRVWWVLAAVAAASGLVFAVSGRPAGAGRTEPPPAERPAALRP
jgi:EmrB/QacA subfamily drug resistance transporter